MLAISGAGLLFAAAALTGGHHDHEEKVHPSYSKVSLNFWLCVAGATELHSAELTVHVL
jgi:hypothetical protein